MDDAPRAGKLLEQLEKKGVLTPEKILELAQDQKHWLHGYFTWDDEKAAYEHRLNEARHFITSVQVVIVREGKEVPVPAVFSLRRSEASGEDQQEPPRRYRMVGPAMKDAELRERIVAQARSELASWERRYSTYTELAAEVATIRGLLPRE